jgi:hypothetical protein
MDWDASFTPFKNISQNDGVCKNTEIYKGIARILKGQSFSQKSQIFTFFSV